MTTIIAIEPTLRTENLLDEDQIKEIEARARSRILFSDYPVCSVSKDMLKLSPLDRAIIIAHLANPRKTQQDMAKSINISKWTLQQGAKRLRHKYPWFDRWVKGCRYMINECDGKVTNGKRGGQGRSISKGTPPEVQDRGGTRQPAPFREIIFK